MCSESPSTRETDGGIPRWARQLLAVATPVAGLIGAVAALITAWRI
jgi:hypothetical protein